jgi:putative N6-adenine-specific DNA methylase
MHRRGYRLESGPAPLSETVAAAILRYSGWRGEEPLLDPFCGSGTLLAEAAFRATGVGVGSLRERYGVRSLPGVDVADFDRRLQEHRRAPARLSEGRLRGGDVDGAMIEMTRQNLSRVPGAEGVELRATDFRDDAGLENGCIVCNPPFGLRLGRGDDAQRLMKEFGDWLKQRCHGSTAWIYLGRRELAKHIGLRPARRIPLRSGGLDGRLLRYELF